MIFSLPDSHTASTFADNPYFLVIVPCLTTLAGISNHWRQPPVSTDASAAGPQKVASTVC